MNITDKRINALFSVVTAEDPQEREKAIADLKKIMKTYANKPTDPESICRDVFLEIGCADHLIGYEYAVSSILMAFEDRALVDNMTFGLYPAVAVKFGCTASRAERAIRHLIETTWTRGNLEAINYYFGSIVDPNRGKPTNSAFIARMVNIIKQKMREAA